jgi:ribosomal-protein-serine acetyltransferase
MSKKRKNLVRPFEVRDISITDASDYQKAFNTSAGHLEKYLEWGASATQFDLQRCQDILMKIAAEKYPDRAFAICSWGKLVGEINFGEGSRQDGLQMTYWVSKNNAGQGLCTKAVKKLMDKAFLMESINFLEIHADKNNLASKKVAKKAGFIHYDSYEYEGYGSEGMGVMDVYIYLTPRARYVETMAKFFGGKGIDLVIRPNNWNRREQFQMISTGVAL